MPAFAGMTILSDCDGFADLADFIVPVYTPLMLRKIVIMALVILTSAVVGMVSLSLLSPNLVYVRSKCASLEHVVAYGNSENHPIANIWSRQLYLFKSSGDGHLTFLLANGKTYGLGYLTNGAPSFFWPTLTISAGSMDVSVIFCNVRSPTHPDVALKKQSLLAEARFF